MSGFGAYLRKRREEKGLTLEEVAERTRVHLRYLEAMEEGNFHLLPGAAYVRGFLRLYAEAVGLDPEAVAEMFAQTEAAKRLESPASGARQEPERPEAAARAAGRRERSRGAGDFVLLVALLTLFGAVATWLYVKAGM